MTALKNELQHIATQNSSSFVAREKNSGFCEQQVL
jgi:hypothetical protein